MKIISKYLHRLYMIYFKWKNRYRKSVIFEKHCIISDNDFFEGNNNVGGTIRNSYVGYGSYIVGGLGNSYVGDCKIGRFCSIASNCHIGLGDHALNMVSTSPLFYSAHTVLPKNFRSESVPVEEETIGDTGYKVIIGNDVWLGYNVYVKPGVTIGDGAVIGAKSVVTKDIPPYSIAVGVPAKVIRYRFTQEQIEKLLEIKWWDKDIEWLKQNVKTFDDVDAFIARFETK